MGGGTMRWWVTEGGGGVHEMVGDSMGEPGGKTDTGTNKHSQEARGAARPGMHSPHAPFPSLSSSKLELL